MAAGGMRGLGSLPADLRFARGSEQARRLFVASIVAAPCAASAMLFV